MQNISSNNQIEKPLCKLKIFKTKQNKFKNLKIITSEKDFVMNPVISSFVFPILCSLCPTVASHMFSFTITNPVLLSLILCSALIPSFYLSFHLSIKGCAWFPSRVQQFLCQMTRSWHHASALHLALHCSAFVWDCLGFYIDI